VTNALPSPDQADGRPVVVTGVAGFIGSHTAALLLDLGFTVIGIDAITPYYSRSTKDRNLGFLVGSPGFSFIEARLSPDVCERAFRDCSAVIHLAAQPGVRDSWEDFATYVDLNIHATKCVLDAALVTGVPQVVCASSSSVYGDAIKYPTREDSQLVPRSPYGVTKLTSERLTVTYGIERGLRTASMRYFTVYGPRQRPDMAFQRMIVAAYTGASFPLYGDGTQIRDFTYVGDVARANAMTAFADVAAGSVFNVCSESPTTLNDIIADVESVTDRQLRIDRYGTALGDVVRTGGSASRIADEVGWAASTSLHDGIRAQAADVRQHLAQVV